MTYSYSTSPVFVSEGQTVRFKFKAPSQWNTTSSVRILIGEQETTWYITTIPEDFAPDPYPFKTLNDADTGVMYVYADGSRPGEDIVTVTGLTTSTEASVAVTGSLVANVSNFAIRVKKVSDGETVFGNWVLPTPGSLTVENTDEIQIKLLSNPIPGLLTYIDVTIGTRTERWVINTKVVPPNIPVPFPDFDDLFNQPLATAVYSNILQVQGLNDTAIISSTNNNLYVGVSDNNTFFTDGNGYEILDNTVFELVTNNPAPTINNGQYLQLYVITENTAGAVSSNPLSIGDESSGSIWTVTNGNFPSTTPKDFSFVNQIDVLEGALIASDPAPDPNDPPGGISELGTNVEVDVVLVSSTSSNDSGGDEPRIKIQYAEGGESSVGLFPTKVNNGDRIVLYNKSSETFSTALTPSVVSTTIKVGQRVLNPWSITTNSGPDTDADYPIPNNLTNQVPGTEVLSSIIAVTGINRPITINATNGATISIDFATPVAGPVTFDPTIHSSFRVFITSDGNLFTLDAGGQVIAGQKETTVTVGTGTPNQFTWKVSNYSVAPPPPEIKGSWYSKKGSLLLEGLVESLGPITAAGTGYTTGNTTRVSTSSSGSGTGLTVNIDADGSGNIISVAIANGGSGYTGSEVITITGSGNGDATIPVATVANPMVIESKEDGHAIGTIVAILKQPNGSYGVLDGSITSRYPGYFECSGQILDKDDYPFLFDVIGYDYGGSGNSFQLPDYRNRKLVGTGVVNGNKASSAQVPVSGGASVYEPGGLGGWWYVDDVDVAGDNPYEIIVSDDTTDTTGIQSNFFSLGTVKTVFDSDIVQDVEFTIASSGSVTAQVGPLLDTAVNVPAHTHLYVAAVPDGLTGDPLIEWGTRGSSILNMHNVSAGLGQSTAPIFVDAGDNQLSSNPNPIVQAWLARLDNYSGAQFEREWDDISGTATLESLVTTLIQSISPSTTDPNDSAARRSLQITANTWWPSPYSGVSDSYLTNVGIQGTFYDVGGTAGQGARNVSAVIDTDQTFVRVDSYVPPIVDGDNNSITETHSHFITTQAVTDLDTDYSYGNQSGVGNGKVGLGSAQESLNLTFTQADVGMELNPGTFTLNTSIKKPIPDVVFSPTRTVPLAPEFHKAKYIIKAF
jgi:hypothetical protein